MDSKELEWRTGAHDHDTSDRRGDVRARIYLAYHASG